MIKGVTHVHLASIWYQPELLEVPYCPNQFLGFDFFAVFLEQTGSNRKFSKLKLDNLLCLSNKNICHLPLNVQKILHIV